MASKEYQKLLNKYNMLVIHVQDMNQRNKRREEAMEEKEKDFKKVNNAAKEFCEKIIRHSEKKENAGDETNFGGDTYDLIINAQQKYNEKIMRDKETLRAIIKQNGALKKTINEKENELKQQIDELLSQKQDIQNQLDNLITQEGLGSLEAEKYKKELEQERLLKEKERKEKAEKDAMMSNFSTKAQNLIHQGEKNADISYGDDDDFDSPSIIQEKNDPVGKKEKALRTENQRIKAKKLTSRSMPTANVPYTENLTNVIDKIDEYGWAMIQAIGTDGKSMYKDIETVCLDKYKVEVPNRVRQASSVLYSSSVVKKVPLNIPLKPNLILYCLSDKGKTIYEKKFGKKPVVSEMELIEKEHSSYKHGYEIMTLSEELKKSENYDDVIYIQQRKATVLPNGNQIIPDIIITSKKKGNIYIEFERNTVNQNGFNKKCRNMKSLSSTMNFIVENQNEMEEISSRVEKWLDNDKLWNTSQDFIIRISTMKAAAIASSLFENTNWQILYMKEKGKMRKIYGSNITKKGDNNAK